ncbi:hypothetical protein C4D60_Mb03t10740 [Musa balbisiana]|uniref:Uncharacterized protein n=1 Tax=Musa balbisiana TaxID=52838 RepID=A0A4S8J928_MUSBA|nr:hypothetical protein C4D60_Mb03t10740 [Musa balbisiana]
MYHSAGISNSEQTNTGPLEWFRTGRSVSDSRIYRRGAIRGVVARDRRAGSRMVYVWLAAFFLLVFLLVLVIYQVSPYLSSR